MVRSEARSQSISRRVFFQGAKAAGTTALTASLLGKGYRPLEAGKQLRIGVVGGGFGAAFPWQRHPNCKVTAVADLREDRRKRLEERFECSNAYADFRAMLKNPSVDAVAIFTGAPHHVPHCVEVMESGRHAISAVPAATTLEQCQQLLESVKKTGQIYMMAETSCFHPSTMTARRLREEGEFGRIYYTQGDYIHDHGTYLAKGEMPEYLERMFFHEGKPTWRYGNAQGLYITHASGPIVHVTGESLVEVAAVGTPLDHPFFKENEYGNPFLNTTFFFKTSGGNSSRINIHWWTAAPGREGADYFGTEMSLFERWKGLCPSAYVTRPHSEPELLQADHSAGLPPSLRNVGGHGGSHPFIIHEFVSACLEQRAPSVDVHQALSYTAPGIVGFHSALKGGDWLKIPDFGPVS